MEENEVLSPAFSSASVNICMASNDAYVPYCTVTLYSLLVNADDSRSYDILILTKDISTENMTKIQLLTGLRKQVSIRFLNMKNFDKALAYDVGAYYSVETNYRLLLFSNMFANYDRMLYLDCDLIVRDDISKLYDVELGEAAVGGVKDYSFMKMEHMKAPIFSNNVPYSTINYRIKVLELPAIEKYVNAGVLLFNLKMCREITDDKRAIAVLNSKPFQYNDQDTLNIIFNESMYMLEIRWNYQNCFERFSKDQNRTVAKMYKKIYQDNPGIIHYVSGTKPWSYSSVTLDEIFHQYVDKMKEEMPEINYMYTPKERASYAK